MGLLMHEARLQGRVALLRKFGSTAAVVMAALGTRTPSMRHMRGATYKEASIKRQIMYGSQSKMSRAVFLGASRPLWTLLLLF